MNAIIGYVIAVVVSALLACGATYYVVHNANAVEIAGLKLATANTQATNANAALSKLTGYISTIDTAAVAYQGDLLVLNQSYADISKALQNAMHQKPLPPGCVPDAGRLSVITTAVTAANRAGTAPAKP